MRPTPGVAYAYAAAIAFAAVPCVGRPQTRDSAGIQVIQHRVRAALPRAPIAIAPTPALVLNEASGDPNQEFSDVLAAVRLTNGTIIVVNRATNELRYFGATGRYLKSAGRKGRGPGEFGSIAAVALLPGDSIMVQDWSSSRVAVFTADGTLGRTFRLGPAPQRPRAALIGVLPDGTLLGAGSDYLTDAEPPPGVFTLTQTLFVFSPNGEPMRPLNQMLERQFVFVALPGSRVSRYVRPFGPIGTVRVARDRYLTGDGTTFEIREFTSSGKLSRILRVDFPLPRVTEEARAVEKQSILAFYGQKTTNPAFERFWAAVPWQDHTPVYRRFEVDPDGRLWVELYQASRNLPPKWLIFDRERRLLGSITLPARFDIRHIARDGILGVRRDVDDVEEVVYYPFARRQ